jgi:hypothetical protein
MEVLRIFATTPAFGGRAPLSLRGFPSGSRGNHPPLSLRGFPKESRGNLPLCHCEAFRRKAVAISKDSKNEIASSLRSSQ